MSKTKLKPQIIHAGDLAPLPFEKVLSSTDTGLWIWSPNPDIVTWSDSLKRLLTADCGESTEAMSFLKSCIHPDDVSRFEEDLKRALKTPNLCVSEIRFKQACGTYKWMNSQIGRVDRHSAAAPLQICGTLANISEVHDLKQKLDHTQHQLRLILDHLPQAVICKDDQNNFIRLNRAAAESMDKSVGAIEGKNMADIVPIMAKENLEKDRAVIKSGKPKLGVLEKYRMDNGLTHWLKVDRIPYKNPNDGTHNILVIAEEVTEQVEHQQKLKESELRLSAILENSFDGVWDWHIQDDNEYMSPRFWEMFGIDPETKSHHPSEWQDLIFETDLKIALDNFDKHVKTRGKHPYAQEVRFRHADGSTVTVYCKGKVIQWGKDGTPIRMVGTHTDLTALKRSQRKATLLGRRFEVAAKNADIGIWDWPIDGSEDVWWSPAYHKIIGDEEQTIIPSFENFHAAVHPDDWDEFKAHLDDHLENNTPFNVEVRHKFKDEGYQWYRIEGKAMRRKDGTAHHMLGLMVNIHARKQAVDALQTYNTQLQQANENLDHFTYIASHDLKAPLRGIQTVISWIIQDLGEVMTPDIEEKLNLVSGRVTRMEHMLTDMLAFSRAGRVELESGPISTAAVVSEVISWVKAPDGFTIHCAKNLPQVVAPLSTLQHIFLNLITNAVKHHDRDKGQVWVEYARRDEFHEFSVRDDGPGIDPQYHKQVFGIFKKLKPRDQVEGSGIGLAIVKKMVEALGGEIYILSTAGKRGTAFRFTLPLED